MTHLWMKLIKGNTSNDPDGRERNLQLLANLVCEIARSELPYPLAIGLERVGPLLESAVGDRSDTSPTVGGVASTLGPDDPLAAAAVGRTSVINGGNVTHQLSPRGPQGATFSAWRCGSAAACYYPRSRTNNLPPLPIRTATRAYNAESIDQMWQGCEVRPATPHVVGVSRGEYVRTAFLCYTEDVLSVPPRVRRKPRRPAH